MNNMENSLSSRNGKGRAILSILTKQKALIAIIGLFVMMIFLNPAFYSTFNMMELLKSGSVMLVLAFGVTLTVICGGCDLSIGSTMCLSGIITIQLMDYIAMPLAILVGLLSGVVIGAINGWLIVKQRTEPFIITLGMGFLLKGVCQQMTEARPISASDPNFQLISNGKIFDTIPFIIIIMIVVFVIMALLMRYTAFGRNCYAIGGDYDVAAYSGINVIFTKWMTYIICGFTAALGGIMLSSLLNSGSSTYGDTTALMVNCGVVVGGTSFAGGVGGMWQSAIGLLVFSVLNNCLNLLGIDPYIQQILQGGVIVAIIWFDCFSRKRKRELV